MLAVVLVLVLVVLVVNYTNSVKLCFIVRIRRLQNALRHERINGNACVGALL